MKRSLAVALGSMLLLATAARAENAPHGPAPDLTGQKDLLDDAKCFLKCSKAFMDKWSSVPDQLNRAVYLSGAKDGALGCGVCLGLLYLLFGKPRKS